MTILVLLIVFLLGAAVGSFANVLIYRIPRRESIVHPGSRCPECGESVRFYDNIPVLSYFILGGRCRACGGGISWRYPAVETVNGLLYLGLVLRLGWAPSTAVMAVFATALLVISFIDLDHRIIPNVITFPGMAAGVLVSLLPGYPRTIDSLVGLMVGYGFLYAVAWVYLAVTKKEGMGMGDVKLLGMIGAFLGWQALPVTVLISSLVGAVMGVLFAAASGEGVRKFPVPFGPFLALGALAHVFFGRELILWYLQRLS